MEHHHAGRQLGLRDPAGLRAFSSGDPGWFAGLAQQAGSQWCGVSGDTWSVHVNDAATKKVAGKWSVAELPQWTAGEHRTGSWGGSSTAVAAKSKHPAQATQFAVWLNTDPTAVNGLITDGGIYPAALDQMQSSTVDGMTKNGFKVSG